MRSVLLLTISLFISTPVLAQSASAPQLKCETGPAKKTFGNGPWLVYACDDGRSVVIVSDSGNPAFPFVFSFTPKDGSLHLFGQGTGKKEATALAYSYLEKLTASEIAALATEAKQAAISKPKGVK